MKSAGKADFEQIKFQVKGIPDSDLNTPAEVAPAEVSTLSKSFSGTPGRRSLIDRKKSKRGEQ